MEFQSLTDAKALMAKTAALLPEDAPYYEDFQFFSAINCTTASEYREELKKFLENFINETAVLETSNEFKSLYPKLVRLCGWL